MKIVSRKDRNLVIKIEKITFQDELHIVRNRGDNRSRTNYLYELRDLEKNDIDILLHILLKMHIFAFFR